jgi:hypothetical protein
MDFFQFLQKSTDNPDNSKKTKRKTKTTQDELSKDKTLQSTSKKQAHHIEQNHHEIEQAHFYIKRGDVVRIVNVPNSKLNSYKGYIGEIRDYKRDQDFALVSLHAIIALPIIKFPLVHLIKYDPLKKLEITPS